MRTNSQIHLASIYGSTQSTSGSGGSCHAVSTSSSPVPWEKGADRGSTSPDILTIQSNPESARETREILEDVGVSTQDDGVQADLQEEEEEQLQRLQLDNGMQTEGDPLCRVQSTTSKSAKQLLHLGKQRAAACNNCRHTLLERACCQRFSHFNSCVSKWYRSCLL
jgi:hypothetical protein